MIFGVSSQLFYPQRLTTGHLDALAAGGARTIELFAARHHVDYADRSQVRELAAWFRGSEVGATMHAPLSAEERFSRHAGATLNLVAGDKSRRIFAMEECKRALELAETVPVRSCVLHLGLGEFEDTWSEYTLEYALTAVEHLKAFAAPLGVKLLLENLNNGIATPAHLLEVLRVGHFDTCGVCLDVAHVHLTDEPMAEVFSLLHGRIGELHLSDNDGRTDAHLWPASGSERPATLVRGTVDWFEVYGLADSLGAEVPAILEVADTEVASAAAATRLLAEVRLHGLRLLENVGPPPA